MLDAAHLRHPERFVNGPPIQKSPPPAAWSNPPPIDQITDRITTADQIEEVAAHNIHATAVSTSLTRICATVVFASASGSSAASTPARAARALARAMRSLSKLDDRDGFDTIDAEELVDALAEVGESYGVDEALLDPPTDRHRDRDREHRADPSRCVVPSA
ncbi:MAG: hypothetical protein ABI467_29195 [Kofleriaceae bacterium]